MKKIDDAGDVAQKEGSGRIKSVRTKENIKLVEKMILNHDEQSGIHSTPVEVGHEINIDYQEVSCISDQDLP